MGLIDTHAHLTFPEFSRDCEEVIQRAFSSGVEAIVTVGAGEGEEGNRRAVELASTHEGIYAAIGIHPHDAISIDIKKAISNLKELAKNKCVVAIGEIGLDYYRNISPPDIQKKVFLAQLELASSLKLPIVIHVRDAYEDAIYILRNFEKDLVGGVFHCFSGGWRIGREAIDMGFYISVPGVVTFKNAHSLKEALSMLPVEKMVIETDSPYLAPEPFRGKRNEPAYVKYIAEELASLKELSVSDVERITTLNAKRLFLLPGFVPEARIAYPIRKSLYLNITNRCTTSCVFCPKRTGSFEVKGYNLKLEREPDVEDVFRAIGDPEGYEEVVFCGFGEPTMRLELMKEIARRLKEKGMKVRLNTDGLANLVHERNVLPELKGLVDSISVSLNAGNAATYARISPSKYGEKAFYAVVDFLKKAKEFIPCVRATVVDYPGVDVEEARRLASELGVDFQVRRYRKPGEI